MRSLLAATALAIGLSASLAATTLRADETADARASKAVVEKKPASPRVKITGLIEGGFTIPLDRPDDRQNFGRLFDDRAAEPLLNQLTVTVERALMPQPGKYDWGFKLQVSGGSDARFLKTLGLLDNINRDRYSVAIVEAYVSAHAPWLFEGGIDFKLGQFATLAGAETLYPAGNFLYSHNYIFNFALPFQHLGLLSTLHISKTLDLYAGVTRGTNVSLTDNNDLPGFHGGLCLNLLDGKLMLMAITHIGPENAGYAEKFLPGLRANRDLRYFNDLVVTWKPNDKFTSITEAIYTYEEALGGQEVYGLSQTLVYQVHPKVALVGRAEILRDDDGFFVMQFARNDDFINLQRGDLDKLDRRTVGGGATTYTEFTIGLNVKPHEHLLIRPELRFDKAIDGHKVFDDSSKSYSFTGAMDVIVTF